MDGGVLIDPVHKREIAQWEERETEGGNLNKAINGYHKDTTAPE